MLAEYPSGLPIILGSDSWHQGVAGIVASRISERYMVPTIIVCFDGHIGRAPAAASGLTCFRRSTRQRSTSRASAGTRSPRALIKREVEAFKKHFCEYYLENTDVGVIPTIDINFEIDEPKVLNIKNVEDLSVLRALGQRKPPAAFLHQGIPHRQIPDKRGKHLKLRLSKNGCVLTVFFAKTLFDLALKQGDCADVAFSRR